MISLVVGLGNIGEKYAGSRHNLGFDLLTAVCEKWGQVPCPGDGDYYIVEKEMDDRPVRLIWPTTYMNNSGVAVSQAIKRYRIPHEEVLIAYDDFNLSLGLIRIRRSGSDGGHNGMSSIIYHLETEAIPRLRMGIGPIPNAMDPVDFVLERFTERELKIKQKMLEISTDAILYSLKNRLDEAMTLYNKYPAPEDEKNSGAV
ncbi:MAG: aminoacyl-tRNA hydrolase [Candidatus Zixiibacteriota bacterium]|nr:MAG: aminoacyl-tRNA hydrolase [candidate division Zixibacteria bacterium]